MWRNAAEGKGRHCQSKTPWTASQGLVMYSHETERPYYYALDRQYNLVMLVDRTGATWTTTRC